MPLNPPRFVVYARRSDDREDKQVLPISAQLTELRELARRLDIKIAEELTESCSAREPGRPVFSKLLKDIEGGVVQGVLAWKLDRLARNPVDAGHLVHLLGKGVLQAIITTEGTYSGQGDSKFLLTMPWATTRRR